MIVHEAWLVTLVSLVGRAPRPPSPATRGRVLQKGSHPTTVSLRCGTMATAGALPFLTTARPKIFLKEFLWLEQTIVLSRPTASECTSPRKGKGRWLFSVTASPSAGTPGGINCRRWRRLGTMQWRRISAATDRRIAPKLL